MVVALTRPIPQFEAPAAAPRKNGWCFADLAGRLVQLEGAGDSASLTFAFTVILEAQQCGEPVAWIVPRDTKTAAAQKDASTAASVFYPPDAYETGVDLLALPVVRVPGVAAVFAAADVLLRSGGFGLIVADLADAWACGRLWPTPWAQSQNAGITSTSLARLAGLARRHHTGLLFLTRSPAAPAQRVPRFASWTARLPGTTGGSLGSLISLHAHSRRRRIGPNQFQCGLAVLKDKQRGPVWQFTEICHGAMGLC